MKTKSTLLTLVLLIIVTSLFSQTTYTVKRKSERGAPSFIKFTEKSVVTHNTFFDELKTEFHLGVFDELRLIETKNDRNSYIHYKYIQFYKGIPVFGGTYIIHEKNNFVTSANGQFIPNLDIDIVPTITKDAAIETGVNSTGIKKYRTDSVKQAENNIKTLFYAMPELIIAPINGDCKKSEYMLCWKFVLADTESPKIFTVFIDAHTGKFVHKINLLYDQDVMGSTVTSYNGTNNVVVNFNPSTNLYSLYQSQTRGPNQSQVIKTNGTSDISSGFSFFNTDPESGSIYWGSEKTYDFYLSKFNRNSLDDNGMQIAGGSHDQTMPDNAYWDGQMAHFGSGDSIFRALVSVDIVGHEYSHGVTQYSSGLVYFSEPGALNESFSDIMGEAIEFYAQGNCDWLMGNNIKLTAPYFIRSFVHPNAGYQPDTYYGNLWDDIEEEVHQNSGVGNYWFYLLTHGGNGTNDNGDHFNITGLGWSDALKITYRSFNYYFFDYTFYYDAVDASIQASEDLFGANSVQTMTVKDAWCAVGLTSIPCYMLLSDKNIREESATLEIVPNPGSGIFTIHYDSEIKNLEIYDITGMKVTNVTDIKNADIMLDLSNLSSGVYIVKCFDKENNMCIKRFIIQ